MTIIPDSIKNRLIVLEDIAKERIRQEELHPEDLDLLMQLVVLNEEVGELSQALQAHYKLPGSKRSDKSDLYEEAIHVSASAARFAEKVLNNEN
ncbi:hypothetical protein [Terrihalobacillus insolitus]|uniref:hypothetical protein n=1 Tax=Terrihalobacillus insolitus TaxID=2950438 RepID=UPI00234186B4|nr:hypothetical protein [Terrihalobacillus insolitus]MDC3412550.1 hypothetical protein [Terrihalobacillus insolitus]